MSISLPTPPPLPRNIHTKGIENSRGVGWVSKPKTFKGKYKAKLAFTKKQREWWGEGREGCLRKNPFHGDEGYGFFYRTTLLACESIRFFRLRERNDDRKYVCCLQASEGCTKLSHLQQNITNTSSTMECQVSQSGSSHILMDLTGTL